MVRKFNDVFDLNKRIGKMLICGVEGSGKTLLSTYIGIQKMLRGQEDCWKSFKEIDNINKLGYTFSKNFEHLLFSNYDMNCKGTYVPNRKTNLLDPFKVGLVCKNYETVPLPPYSFLIITEAQRVFNAYMWQYLRAEVRAFWETSRQANIEIILDTNQPELIYKGMRELLNRIIYLYKDTEEVIDKEGNVKGHRLYIKEFKKYKYLEKYLENSNENLVMYTYILELVGCLYSNYDSYQCKMLHLNGRTDDDYNIAKFPDIKTIEDVEMFAENFGLYPPEGYYVKPSTNVKQSNNKEEIIGEIF